MITCTFPKSTKHTHLRHVTVAPIVIRHNQLLIIKRALRLSCGGKYGLPGGYVDHNERIFSAASREVFEETGYQTHRPQLFLINDKPDRYQDDNQNIDFVVLLDAGEQTGTPDDEVTQVLWVKIDEIPPASSWAFDHYHMVSRYLEYRANPCVLPIFGFDYTIK